MKNRFFLILKNKIFAVLGILFFVVSCSTINKNESSTSSSHNVVENNIPDNSMLLDLSPYFYPLQVFIPDSSKGELEVESNTDYVQIKVGEVFNIELKYGGDIALKKEDLKNDLLYLFEVINEDEETLIYSQTLPDKSNTFYHFYAVKNIDGETYEISDVSLDKAFSKKRIEKMVEYIRTLSSNKPKV